ncbi:LuxR C-terminal-related transcriptional regulator, partial [bacterium]|nr:LuxR C-terminal-related transcriptional regulator [bacterium]
IEHSLRERIKELNCLYGVAELIEESEDDMPTAMQGITNLLPDSWQYPEITTARIVLKDVEYNTPIFKTSPWRQTAEIFESDEKIGFIEVYYVEEMPPIDEGPFLKDERLLINAIAIRIGSAIERISAMRQLEIERKSLQNANITLREVLTKVKEEQNEIGKVILSNLDKAIMPVLHALQAEVSPTQQKYIELVQKSLKDITSPFISKLSGQFMELTSSEIQICNMIRSGLSTKEIADFRHISFATVNRHRENIRKKLGLKNQKVNLQTFLQNHMSEQIELLSKQSR